MIFTGRVPVLAAFVVLAVCLTCPSDVASAGDEAKASSHQVAKTYNDSPFEYSMRPLRKTEAFDVYRLEYPSPVVSDYEPNNTVPADYYLPKGIGPGSAPRPAVVCLHILGSSELVSMLCSSLASRGVPAIMFKFPYYDERGLPGGQRDLFNNPRLFLEGLQQGRADVRRTVDLLASRPEIDAKKIGVSGISMGGMLGAATAGIEPRLHRAAFILAGGDLLSIFETANEARAMREFLAKLPADQRDEMLKLVHAADPLTNAKGLRGRAEAGRVMMINSTDDKTVPKSCTDKLAAALGMTERVIWLDGLGHYTAMAALPRIMKTTVDFFAADLPEGVISLQDKSLFAKGDPKRMVISLLQQTMKIIDNQPKAGRCHFVDFEFTAKLPDGAKGEGRLQFVHGNGDKFRLGVKIKQPLNIEVEMGQDECPWIAAAGKKVFRGSKESESTESTAGTNPLAYVEEEHLLKLQMANGLVMAASLMPTMLDKLASVSEETDTGGARVLKITPKDKKQGSATLTMLDGAGTPDELRLSVQGIEATLKFHVWQTDTIGRNELFQPPSELPLREVARDDVYRIFSSLYNFAMEMAQ